MIITINHRGLTMVAKQHKKGAIKDTRSVYNKPQKTAIMDQNEDGTKAPAQHTHGPTQTKAVHQTSEQSRRSEQIQTNFQQPLGFSNAQATKE